MNGTIGKKKDINVSSHRTQYTNSAIHTFSHTFTQQQTDMTTQTDKRYMKHKSNSVSSEEDNIKLKSCFLMFFEDREGLGFFKFLKTNFVKSSQHQCPQRASCSAGYTVHKRDRDNDTLCE